MDLDINFTNSFKKKIDSEAYVKACRKGLLNSTNKLQRLLVLNNPFRTGGTRKSWLLKKLDINSYLIYNHHRSGQWNIANLLNVKGYIRKSKSARTQRIGTTKFGNPKYSKVISSVRRAKGFIDVSISKINVRKEISSELTKYIQRIKN